MVLSPESRHIKPAASANIYIWGKQWRALGPHPGPNRGPSAGARGGAAAAHTAPRGNGGTPRCGNTPALGRSLRRCLASPRRPLPPPFSGAGAGSGAPRSGRRAAGCPAAAGARRQRRPAAARRRRQRPAPPGSPASQSLVPPPAPPPAVRPCQPGGPARERGMKSKGFPEFGTDFFIVLTGE